MKIIKNIFMYLAFPVFLIGAYLIVELACFFALAVFIIQHIVFIIVSPHKTARLFKYYSIAQSAVAAAGYYIETKHKQTKKQTKHNKKGAKK